jgi:hypothetical protein
VGNGYQSELTFDHCLLQGAITAGEYVGGAVTINHSAVIGFPEESGEVNAELADADYDGIYFTQGNHTLINSLFGFCKDDAIDAGSGGAGSVTVSNCWVEAALHEALAWSGEGRVTRTYDTVLINNGQGIEAGWSSGIDSPLVYADRLLSTANSVGARLGDNYDWSYNGLLNVSNSIILHNYRDIWGYNWADWTYRVGQMDLHDNYVSTVNTNHPNNTLWDPSSHAGELAPYMTTPTDAPVGIGLAVWDKQSDLQDVTNGVPVRLSSFTTHPVSIGYAVANSSGVTLDQGTLEFQPGETLKWIRPVLSGWENQPFLKVDLNNPVQGELTGESSAYFVVGDTNPPPARTVIFPLGSTWKYLVTATSADPAWTGVGYSDAGWPEGRAQLGYGDGDEATLIGSGPDANNKYPTTYFRKTIILVNPETRFDSLDLRLVRDDGGVVHINGTEVFRSPNMPDGDIFYNTHPNGGNGENTIDTANFSADVLVNGANVVAAEIHQANATSSDLSFDLELTALATPARPTLQWVLSQGELVLLWSDPNFILHSADSVDGPWTPVPGASSPWIVDPAEGHKLYQLQKN